MSNQEKNDNSEEESNSPACNRCDYIFDYFAEQGIEYKIKALANLSQMDKMLKDLEIPPQNYLRGVLLKDNMNNLLLAICPVSSFVDLISINDELNRELKPAKNNNLPEQFKTKYSIDSLPPVPNYFCNETIADIENDCKHKIAFANSNSLIIIDYNIFKKMLGSVTKACDFTIANENLSNLDDNIVQENVFVKKRQNTRIDKVFELPAMPDMLNQILSLRSDVDSNVNKLIEVISLDPSLSMQIISWASSPFYGVADKINSIHDAIVKALGYDLVLNLALGIALNNIFSAKIDKQWLRKYWQESLNCAYLSGKIAAELKIDQGMAYLCGLLHNVGALLCSNVFPHQTEILNNYLVLNHEISKSKVVAKVLGTTWQRIGSRLLTNWNMPEEVIQVVRWQDIKQDPDSHADYVRLVSLVNLLLKHSCTNFSADNNIIYLASKLNLKITDLETVIAKFKEQSDEIDATLENVAGKN